MGNVYPSLAVQRLQEAWQEIVKASRVKEPLWVLVEVPVVLQFELSLESFIVRFAINQSGLICEQKHKWA